VAIRSFLAIFNQTIRQPIVPKMPLWKGVAFAAGVGLAMLSYPLHAALLTGGETVQGLYDALLNTMKNGRTLGQSGRFTQLEPVIRRSFDIASMTRLSVGASWASLTEGQRQQMTESFGRYISAIYADRFDSYAGQKLEVTGERATPSGVIVKSEGTRQRTFLTALIGRIDVGANQIDIHFRPTRLSALLDIAAEPLPSATENEAQILSVPVGCATAGGRSRC
jgi:hypothetical protein